jgi:hypothetical protein
MLEIRAKRRFSMHRDAMQRFCEGQAALGKEEEAEGETSHGVSFPGLPKNLAETIMNTIKPTHRERKNVTVFRLRPKKDWIFQTSRCNRGSG